MHSEMENYLAYIRQVIYTKRSVNPFLTSFYINGNMFGTVRCKLCDDNVRFVLKHLKEKHSETLKDPDVVKLNMPKIMKKYFT